MNKNLPITLLLLMLHYSSEARIGNCETPFMCYSLPQLECSDGLSRSFSTKIHYWINIDPCTNKEVNKRCTTISQSARYAGPFAGKMQRKLFIGDRLFPFETKMGMGKDSFPSKGDKWITIKKGDSTYAFTEREIKSRMQFGPTEKATSIIIGGLLGAYVFGAAGRFIEGFDKIEKREFPGTPTLIGIGIGLIAGPIINYKLIEHLARGKAIDKLISEENTKKKEEQ